MTQVENMSERFADIQMLRYSLPGFQELSTRQKAYIYYLSEATLWGRDITFDQFGRYNLLIRRTLEAVYQVYQQHDDETKNSADYQAFEEYLKRVWFSNGIYHHYGSEKFQPGFSLSFFENAVRQVPADKLPMPADELLKVITPVIFDPDVLPQRVNRTPGDDLVLTSACNYYQDGVTQAEVEAFYKEKQQSQPEANAADNGGAPSWGLNSTLCRNEDGTLREDVWYLKGKYGPYIEKIIGNLEKAKQYAENEQQERVIDLLIDYYTTGDLHTFDVYSIEWLK